MSAYLISASVIFAWGGRRELGWEKGTWGQGDRG